MQIAQLRLAHEEKLAEIEPRKVIEQERRKLAEIQEQKVTPGKMAKEAVTDCLLVG